MAEADLAAAVGRHGVGLPDRRNFAGGRLLFHLWGIAVHCVALACGFVLLINAMQVATMLVDFTEPWNGLFPSLKVFGNVMAMPFVGLPSEDPLATSSVEIWGLWVPLFMSIFLLLVAFLGFGTLRSGVSPGQAAVYVILASVLLVWQAQAGQIIGEMASWENMFNNDVVDEVRAMQKHLFKMTYEGWAELYNEHHCTSIQTGSERSLECSAETLEAQLMSVIVQEFCRAQTSRSDFSLRSQQCLEQGRQLKFLDGLGKPSDVDVYYCQCRTAIFDFLAAFSHWFIVLWLALLIGVLAALYAVVEPRLLKVAPEARREILLFGALGSVFLAIKAMMFADELPWSAPSDSNLLADLLR